MRISDWSSDVCSSDLAELLVVVGADPLSGVDGALFQRRIDVAAGDLLRHQAQLDQHLAGEAADTHLEAIQVLDGLDFLTEPAAHLRAGEIGRASCRASVWQSV